MDISDMELSPNSRSNNSSRSSTPKPEKPMTDCERRRSAMIRLHQQNTMIDGYKQYLKRPVLVKGEDEIHREMERNLKFTIDAREKLVSELRTMPPCLVFNCPDHTTLETKNSAPKSLTENSITNEIDKKPSQKRKKTPKITRMTLSFPVKPLALPLQRKYLNQLKFKTPMIILMKTPKLTLLKLLINLHPRPHSLFF
ncbi:uncharacterized protein TNCV_2670641 [Trichonephila clavipes]|nr:uncharacterized protein TNCV_2670641 [Trichonephila clavipes]